MSATGKKKGRRVPAYLKLKNKLRADILSRKIEGRLPSERDLAEMHGMSHMTARRAVCELVDEGLARRERGRRGTFAVPTGEAFQTMNIAVLVDFSHAKDFPPFPGPYYDEVVAGIQDGITAEGYVLVIPRQPEDVLPMLSDSVEPGGTTRRKVDGVIVFSDFSGKKIEAIRREIPLVTVNRMVPGIPAVLPDNYAGALAMTSHLIDIGHSRLGHVTGIKSELSAAEREKGFRCAHEEAGLRLDESLIVEGDYTFEGGVRAAKKLLSRSVGKRPTAIFCADDMCALGVLRTANQMGISVPAELSVAGFDDLVASRESTPALSTIHVPRRRMGRMAADALLEWLSSGTVPEAATTVLSVELVKRDSCNVPGVQAGEK